MRKNTNTRTSNYQTTKTIQKENGNNYTLRKRNTKTAQMPNN